MALIRQSQSIGIFLSLTLWVMCLMETTSFSITMMASGNTNKRTKNRPKQKKNSKPGSIHVPVRKATGTTSRTNHNVANHDTKPSPKPNPKKIHTRTTMTIEELSKMSIAQAIVKSTSSKHLLHTSNRQWLPTDDNLPSHLRTEASHHEKRIKAASQLLKRLGDCIGNERGVAFDAKLWNEAGENGFRRAILAASIPFHDMEKKQEQEIKNTCIALMGLHAIVGFTLPHASSRNITLDPHILEAIKSLIQRADLMASTSELAMHEAVEVRWASRGIISRIGSPLSNLLDGIDDSDSDLPRVLKRAIPNLEERVAKLPFDIIPSCLDWNHFDGKEKQITVKILLSEIPFNFDTITTRTGLNVEERRGTAWIADEGIGSMAYSGKFMAPHALPPIVSEAMRQVEQGILAHDDPHTYEQLEVCCQEIGTYFDCALCNHYPNGEVAMKFHMDPEHGTYWERLACVVSVGDDDVRKFAFRPIPDLNEWDKFETRKFQKNKNGHQNDNDDNNGKSNGIFPAVIFLFPGDVVKMDSECNDLFHHAVQNRQDVSRVGSTNELVENSDGRVSLVLKRAMDRGSGRKGHADNAGGVVANFKTISTIDSNKI
jgi:hypothetical protein